QATPDLDRPLAQEAVGPRQVRIARLELGREIQRRAVLKLRRELDGQRHRVDLEILGDAEAGAERRLPSVGSRAVLRVAEAQATLAPVRRERQRAVDESYRVF